MKVGIKWVFIARTCFLDVNEGSPAFFSTIQLLEIAFIIVIMTGRKFSVDQFCQKGVNPIIYQRNKFSFIHRDS